MKTTRRLLFLALVVGLALFTTPFNGPTQASCPEGCTELEFCPENCAVFIATQVWLWPPIFQVCDLISCDPNAIDPCDYETGSECSLVQL